MKYKFEIVAQNKYVRKASDLLDKWDLGVGDIAFKEIMTFESKKDLEISEIKELIKQAYESCECKLLHIEGGKIE